MFLDYENKLSNVTLVFVDDKHFCAHKGSKIQNQYEPYNKDNQKTEDGPKTKDDLNKKEDHENEDNPNLPHLFVENSVIFGNRFS